MPPEISHVRQHVLSILENSENKSLLGSHLSGQLKLRCSEFKPSDYGLRNLRDFLRTHVPEVYESSRQGLDFVYTLSPSREGSSPAPSPTVAAEPTVLNSESKQTAASHLDDELWKTFISPSSPYRLFLNDSTSEFRVIGLREDAPAAPWVQVPPCSVSRHRSIADEFVATLSPGDQKTKLTEILSTQKVWWIPFFEATRHLGIEKPWLEFRRAAVYDELRKTLSSLGISPTRLEGFKQQGATHTKRIIRDSVRPDRTELRRLALAIVGRISESELRDLRFRLGDVLDALGGK